MAISTPVGGNLLPTNTSSSTPRFGMGCGRETSSYPILRPTDPDPGISPGGSERPHPPDPDSGIRPGGPSGRPTHNETNDGLSTQWLPARTPMSGFSPEKSIHPRHGEGGHRPVFELKTCLPSGDIQRIFQLESTALSTRCSIQEQRMPSYHDKVAYHERELLLIYLIATQKYYALKKDKG